MQEYGIYIFFFTCVNVFYNTTKLNIKINKTQQNNTAKQELPVTACTCTSLDPDQTSLCLDEVNRREDERLTVN